MLLAIDVGNTNVVFALVEGQAIVHRWRIATTHARTADEYDQSIISTILILPSVVTSIVVVVQHSLALAFALSGIAGAVRFKNSLRSSGDALYILLSVGIGLASGIGAVELALVMSLAFNYCFVALWISEYGEREGMKRYMSDFNPEKGPASAAVVNPPTKPKYQYWTGGPAQGTDVDAWVAKATEHAGSWWPDWLKWLKAQNDATVPARAIGGGKLQPIEDAPGSYVKVKSWT